MSDDRPHNAPTPEDDWQDTPALEEEAYFAEDSDIEDWDDVSDLDEESYLEETEDLDASIYEPPEPPVTDAAFEPEEPPEDDGNWFQKNWRAIVLAALVVIIVALVARAFTGRKEQPTPTPLPTATFAPLPTFTPTPEGLAPTPPPGNAMPPASSPLETPPPVEATQPPVAATQPPPVSGGQIAVGQTVIVTGTGKDRLSLRAKPTTKSARVKLIKDGVKLTVIDGPKKADGYTWWKVRTPKGIEGWAVEDFLKPQ